MQRFMILASILLSFYLVLGCGGGHHRLNLNPNADSSQIALIKGKSHTPLKLHEIDGMPGSNYGGAGIPKVYNSNVDRSFNIELPPGKHVFKVGYYEYVPHSVVIGGPGSVTMISGGSSTSSVTPQLLTIDTEPGCVYVIDFKIHPNNQWEAYYLKVKQGGKEK